MIKVLLSSSLFILLTTASTLADEQEIKMLLAKPFAKAEFTKIRKLQILSRPFTTSGKILFLPEKGLVWQTLQPIEDTLLIGLDGVSQLKEGQAEPVKIENPVVRSASTVFITILSLDLDKIKKIFKIKEQSTSSQIKNYTLVPKDETLKKVIKSIQLSGKERVEEIYIEEISGDFTLVKIHNEQFNKTALSPSELRLLELM
ncbi:MAG: outer membrane lipoprotein carrier protein LolA [Thioalkalispiraceae bacterium]|jgi:hypothetical protein